VSHEILVFGDATWIHQHGGFTGRGKQVTLTSQEFKLLKFFAGSPDVVHRATSFERSWGYKTILHPHGRQSHFAAYGQKLEPDSANPRFSSPSTRRV